MSDFVLVTSDIGRIASVESSDVTFNVILDRDAKKGEVIPLRLHNVLFGSCSQSSVLREEVSKLEKQREEEEQRIVVLGAECDKVRDEKEELGKMIEEEEKEVAKLGKQREEEEQRVGILGAECAKMRDELDKMVEEKEKELVKMGEKLEKMREEFDKMREEEKEWEGKVRMMELREADWKKTKQKEEREWQLLREAAVTEAREMGEKEMAEWDKNIAELREADEAERKRLDDESERLRKEKARLRNEEEERQWRQEMKVKQEMELKARAREDEEWKKRTAARNRREEEQRAARQEEWARKREAWVKEDEERLIRLHRTEMATEEADRVLQRKVQSSLHLEEQIAALKRQVAETQEQLERYKEKPTSYPSPGSDTLNPAPTVEPDGGQRDMARIDLPGARTRRKTAFFRPLSEDSDESSVNISKKRKSMPEGRSKPLTLCLPRRLSLGDQHALQEVYEGSKPSTSSAAEQAYKWGRGGTYNDEEVASICDYFHLHIQRGEAPPRSMCEHYLVHNHPHHQGKSRTSKDIQDKVRQLIKKNNN